MNKHNVRKMQRGQGLPEYALTMILVAVVSILILILVGMGVSRIYGILVGITGTKHNGDQINIVEASCYVYMPGEVPGWQYGTVAWWIWGYTDVPLNKLELSTDLKFETGMPTLKDGQVGTFLYNPQIVENALGAVIDPSKCPHSLVIQGNGTTSVSPVRLVRPPEIRPGD